MSSEIDELNNMIKKKLTISQENKWVHLSIHFRDYLKRHKSAIKIQSYWRCYHSRKKYLQDKKIKNWLIQRNRENNKGKIDILPKNVLLTDYISFVTNLRNHLKTEMKLNCYIGRIPNFPERISENIVLYVLRHLNVKCTWRCKGDILVGETNIQGEVKCHFNGPSQFSPSKKKDGHILYYLEAEDHIYHGYFKLYKIENYNTELKNVQINKNSLLENQQDLGRRPRFTIKDIWKDDLKDKLIWKGTVYELLK